MAEADDDFLVGKAPQHVGLGRVGLMTEAAERVTEYAFVTLWWPHLWLNNAEANLGSHRVKVKQGAREVARVPRDYVSGPGVAVIWLLTREDWLARRGRKADPDLGPSGRRR